MDQRAEPHRSTITERFLLEGLSRSEEKLRLKLNPRLCGADGVHAIRIKHVAQRNYALKFVDIGTVYHRQNIDMGAAHAFQRNMQSVVSMHVRKLNRIQQAQQC